VEAMVAGIDVGTTRVKLRVYDQGYNVLYKRDDAAPLRIDGPVAEHDPEKLYGVVRGFVDEAVNRGVKCLGLTVYRGSLVVWRRDGKPLYGVATWMDRRSEIGYRGLPLAARLLSRLPGVGSALKPEAPIVRLAVAIREEPRLAGMLEKGEALAWNVDSYLIYRLISRHVSDATISTLTGLIHPGSLKPMRILAKTLGLPRFEVPEILPHDEASGEYRGAVVGPPIGDQQAASHALGCVEEGCLRITIGTGLFLDYVTGGSLRLRPGEGFIPVVIGHDSSGLTYGAEIYAAGVGTAVDAVVSTFLGGRYDLLEEALYYTGRPPIVHLLPWGLRRPRTRGAPPMIEARGSPRDIAAGVAHSLAAVVALHYRAVEESLGRPHRITLTGGLSRAPGIAKLIASYIGRSIEVSQDPDASALGAAVVAAKACGIGAAEPRLGVGVIGPDPDLVLVEPEEIAELAVGLSGRLV